MVGETVEDFDVASDLRSSAANWIDLWNCDLTSLRSFPPAFLSSDGDRGADGDPVVALSVASESVAVAGGVATSATAAIVLVDRVRPG